MARAIRTLLFEPDASPAVAGIARVEEDKTGAVECLLNCSERASARIGPAPLQVLNRDFGQTRRPGQLDLCPIKQPAGRAYLFARNHSSRIVENARRNNHIDLAIFPLDTFLYSAASKIYRLPKSKDVGLMVRGVNATSAPEAVLPTLRRGDRHR
jgi:hypothetical protein